MSELFVRLIQSPATTSLAECTELEANSAGLWAKALPDGRCVIGADCRKVLDRHYRLSKALA